jgi:phage regulator Rha-like protein
MRLADSRDVAVDYSKEHKHVLRDVRELKCSDEFRRLNFEPRFSKDLERIPVMFEHIRRGARNFCILGG